MKKKSVKVDWKVFAIADQTERNNPEAIIRYVTDIYDKYGFGQIEAFGRVKNAKKIMNLINTVGRMMAEGEVFDEDATHTISDTSGTVDYKFNLKNVVICGEKFVILYPDFESEIYNDRFLDNTK